MASIFSLILKAYRRSVVSFASNEVQRAARKLAQEISWDGVVPGRPTVLVARRAQFSKDVEQLRQRTNLNFAAISAVKVKKVQEPWVPENLRQQTYFTALLDGAPDLKNRLEEFGSAFLLEASRRIKIDAFMVANFDYWQDEAIKLGCAALGIPFLVLSRENYTIPWTSPWLHRRIAKAKFRFHGNGVACFSHATKTAMSPGLADADDIWVTGAPRYDPWLNITPRPVNEKTHITLVTFNLPGYGAQDLFAEVLQQFAKTAAAAADRQVTWLVKCKKRADYDEISAKVPASNNLSLTYDTPLFDVFPVSRLVIGYNSLALVEALLTDTPVVIPWWGQTKADPSQFLLDPNDSAVAEVIYIARSPQEFAMLLRRAAAGEDLRRGSEAQRRAIFSRHMQLQEHGTASEAVEGFIRYYLAKGAQLPAGLSENQ